jgi:DNA-binding MarR family transcriptional regulator
MAEAGFDDRRLPDGRVLRLCADPVGSTISNIGRKLGMTRQGAGKVVSHLQDRGYVAVADSPTSGREKTVTLTALGDRYLSAQRSAARTIERNIDANLREAGLGDDALRVLLRFLEHLPDDEGIRMRGYLTRTAVERDPLDDVS